jgi:spore coat polysaccharide biosynthesis predicted glycosyltransferase SpsG
MSLNLISTLVFRADLSEEIGVGHVMRCKSIAEAAIRKKKSCVLVIDNPNIPLIKKYNIDKYFSRIISPENLNVLNTSMSALIVDSYNISSEDDIFKLSWHKIFSISDSHTPDYKTDKRIIQNPKQLKSNESDIFFPIINDFYFELRQIRMRRTHNVTLNILIIGGGTDYNNFVQSMAEELSTISGKFKFYAVSKRKLDLDDSRFEFVKFGDEFKKYLPSCDLIFSTSGTSIWEFLVSQIPMGIGISTLNQNDNFTFFADNQLALPVAKFQFNKWEIDLNKCRQLMQNDSERNKLIVNQNKFANINSLVNLVDLI